MGVPMLCINNLLYHVKGRLIIKNV